MKPIFDDDIDGIPVYTENGLVYFDNWRDVEAWYFAGIYR